MFTVYSIAAPGALEPFYIGHTMQLPRRIRDHLDPARPEASRQRIAAMLAADLVPVFRILGRFETKEAAIAAEMLQIAAHVARGVPLANSANEIRLAREWPVEKATG